MSSLLEKIHSEHRAPHEGAPFRATIDGELIGVVRAPLHEWRTVSAAKEFAEAHAGAFGPSCGELCVIDRHGLVRARAKYQWTQPGRPPLAGRMVASRLVANWTEEVAA